jgi:hypothetical protein
MTMMESLVLTGITAAFLVFAVTLFWADLYTAGARR